MKWNGIPFFPLQPGGWFTGDDGPGRRCVLFGFSETDRGPSWLTRFQGDRSDVQGLRVLMATVSPEKVYLDQEHGRQILHVTFGSVLTEKTAHDYRFRERIRTIHRQNRQQHEDILRDHLGRHIQMLLMG